MKSKFGKISLAVLAVLCTVVLFTSIAFAVPASGIQQELTQPTGEKFYATVRGDEITNWTESESGDAIVKGTDNFWYYGELNSDKLTAGTKKFKLDAKPSKTVKSPEMIASAQKAKQAAPPAPLGVSPQSGTQKLLVVLVEFNDIGFIYGDDLWRTSFFGGVNAFYNEISHGKFQFAPAGETQGTANDGIIHVKLNYNHPNTAGNIGTANQKMVKDALTAADPYINFASFDTDGNGAISSTELHIAFMVAGYEAAYDSSAPSVWAHRWSVSGGNATTLDGKKLCNATYAGGYVQQGERHSTHMATIGTLCHELGHDITLPDLYDTDYTSEGVGVHSLMAGGSWASAAGGYPGSSPSHMDAYCKVGLGWVTPVTVSGTGTYTLYSASSSSDNILKVTTSTSSQYFLVENRQFTGYDAGLTYDCASDSSGILILHVDTTIANNNNEARKLVDVEEANQGTLGYSQLDTANYSLPYYHYYKSGVNTTFGPTGTPNSNLYSGASTNITISVPGTSSSAMSVTVSR